MKLTWFYGTSGLVKSFSLSLSLSLSLSIYIYIYIYIYICVRDQVYFDIDVFLNFDENVVYYEILSFFCV